MSLIITYCQLTMFWPSTDKTGTNSYGALSSNMGVCKRQYGNAHLIVRHCSETRIDAIDPQSAAYCTVISMRPTKEIHGLIGNDHK
eukprot:scaffold117928_cov32-Prasinocladus_malaysianus.AAC.5